MPPEKCSLCQRPLEGPITKHHLLPKSRGGKGTETVELHKICHDKIHRVFNEKSLATYYHTFERMQENEEICVFIQWLQNKPPDYYDISQRKRR